MYNGRLFHLLYEGIPVWWYTTSIHRPNLPHARMQRVEKEIKNAVPVHPVHVHVYISTQHEGGNDGHQAITTVTCDFSFLRLHTLHLLGLFDVTGGVLEDDSQLAHSFHASAASSWSGEEQVSFSMLSLGAYNDTLQTGTLTFTPMPPSSQLHVHLFACCLFIHPMSVKPHLQLLLSVSVTREYGEHCSHVQWIGSTPSAASAAGQAPLPPPVITPCLHLGRFIENSTADDEDPATLDSQLDSLLSSRGSKKAGQYFLFLLPSHSRNMGGNQLTVGQHRHAWMWVQPNKPVRADLQAAASLLAGTLVMQPGGVRNSCVCGHGCVCRM